MLDRIDKAILEILQNNSQISNQDLAEKVALSPSPCLRRVKRLEEEGYIEKYVARLNPQKVNLKFAVLVSIGLGNHSAKKMKEFEETLANLPEVVQCYLIAGQTADYLLKVVVSDLEEYQNFLLKKLLPIHGVNNVHSSFILQNVIDKTALPIK